MVRTAEGPLAQRLRMQCGRGEQTENYLHIPSLWEALQRPPRRLRVAVPATAGMVRQITDRSRADVRFGPSDWSIRNSLRGFPGDERFALIITASLHFEIDFVRCHFAGVLQIDTATEVQVNCKGNVVAVNFAVL